MQGGLERRRGQRGGGARAETGRAGGGALSEGAQSHDEAGLERAPESCLKAKATVPASAFPECRARGHGGAGLGLWFRRLARWEPPHGERGTGEEGQDEEGACQEARQSMEVCPRRRW